MEEFDELFGGRVSAGKDALQIEDILAESDAIDGDLHAASYEQSTSRHPTLASDTLPIDTETQTPDDIDKISSEDEDVIGRLASERQEKAAATLGKRKRSALTVQPIAPVPKKVKKTGGMQIAGSIDTLTREMRRQTSQREDEVEEMKKNLPQTPIEKAFALVQKSFGDDEEFFFFDVRDFLSMPPKLMHISLFRQHAEIYG